MWHTEPLEFSSFKTIEQVCGCWQNLEKTLLSGLSVCWVSLIYYPHLSICSLFQDFWNLNGGSWTRTHHSNDSSSSLDRKMWLSPGLFWLVLWGKLAPTNLLKPHSTSQMEILPGPPLPQSVLLSGIPSTYFIWSSTHNMRRSKKRLMLLLPRSRNHNSRGISNKN